MIGPLLPVEWAPGHPVEGGEGLPDALGLQVLLHILPAGEGYRAVSVHRAHR
jgi:hypothetical protein